MSIYQKIQNLFAQKQKVAAAIAGAGLGKGSEVRVTAISFVNGCDLGPSDHKMSSGHFTRGASLPRWRL